MYAQRYLTLIAGVIMTATVVAGGALAGSPADRSTSRLFDYSHRGLGLGGYIGLGVASQGGGAGFQFGVTSKIRMWQGIMLDPGFHMYVRSGVWAIALQPAPQWIFRFRKSKVHPYAGFGPAIYIVHHSNQNAGLDFDDFFGFNDPFDRGGTGVKFGLHWTWGAELALTPNISLYNDYKFHLVFEEADLFSLTFGMYYYLN